MPATTPLEASQQGSNFYTWSFPGAPVQVYLYFEVVQGIRRCLKQASSTGDSASVRGLLLGKINTPGLPEITGFRQLSTANAAELEAAIAFFKNSGDNLLPLGYFRVHTEDHLALAPDDLSLAQAFFSDPNSVFLLIQPTDTRAANAGFFFWDRGKMNGGFYDFCFLEFPFDVSLLAATGLDTAKPDPIPSTDATLPELVHPMADLTVDSMLLPQAASAPENPPPNAQENIVPTGTPPRHSRPWRVARFALGAMLFTLAGLAAGIFLSLKLPWIIDSPRSLDTTPIALRVDQRGKDLAITWNHASSLVTGAVTGRLTIYDGGSRELPLDEYNIRSGSVVYSPVTDHVRVQLDLQTPDQRVTSESVTIILTRPGTTAPTVVVQPMGIRPQRPFPPAAFDAEPAGAGPPPSTSPARAKVLATRQFLPPHDRAAAPLQPPELAPPPAVTAKNSLPAAVVMPALTMPPGQASPPPKANNTNAQTQAATKPPERLHPIGASNSDYVPPVPIRQILPPPLTPFQRSLISRTVVVEIKVFIDASGKVRKTDRLNQVNPVLATAAESVAKLWTFQPARKAGQPVPSEMILQFKFDGPK